MYQLYDDGGMWWYQSCDKEGATKVYDPTSRMMMEEPVVR